MAKRSHGRRHRRSRSHKRRHQRGGSYTSAATYGMEVNGPLSAQFSRTFDTSGPFGDRVGSEYVGAQGQWSVQPGSPTAQQLALVQSAGRRKRRRSKRGGFLGPVISQAIVPATILGLQQTYRRKGYNLNRTFRNNRFSRRR